MKPNRNLPYFKLKCNKKNNCKPNYTANQTNFVSQIERNSMKKKIKRQLCTIEQKYNCTFVQHETGNNMQFTVHPVFNYIIIEHLKLLCRPT